MENDIMKTGFYRTTIKDDNKRFNNGYYHVVYRFMKDGKAISFSDTSINGLRNKAWAYGLPWRITDEEQAAKTLDLEHNLMIIDNEYQQKIINLREAEKQIQNDKNKLNQLMRDEKSKILFDYKKNSRELK